MTGSNVSQPSIRLWRIPLAVSEKYLDECRQFVSSDEKLRADRYRVPDARRRFLVCRRALREILGRDLHVDPTLLTFGSNPWGKPFLERPQEATLRFNVSHSGDWGIVALCSGAAIGVDIEVHQSLTDSSTMFNTLFSEDENQQLAPQNQELKICYFYRHWVAKEAVGKAIGVGIGLGPHNIRIQVNSRTPDQFVGSVLSGPVLSESRGAWLDSPPGYSAAVAILTASEEEKDCPLEFVLDTHNFETNVG